MSSKAAKKPESVKGVETPPKLNSNPVAEIPIQPTGIPIVNVVEIDGKFYDPEGNEIKPVVPPTPEFKEKVLENKADREAAEAVLEMIGLDMPNQGNRFWEILRDEAIAKVGMPMKAEIKELAPFDTVRAEVFMKQAMPRGRYAETSVLTVEKKEGIEFLERFATKQDFFQRGLSRYILWRKKNPLKKAKKKRKKANAQPPKPKQRIPSGTKKVASNAGKVRKVRKKG